MAAPRSWLDKERVLEKTCNEWNLSKKHNHFWCFTNMGFFFVALPHEARMLLKTLCEGFHCLWFLLWIHSWKRLLWSCFSVHLKMYRYVEQNLLSFYKKVTTVEGWLSWRKWTHHFLLNMLALVWIPHRCGSAWVEMWNKQFKTSVMFSK